MSTFALWRLFHRPGLRGSAGHTSMLAIIAFAAATTIFLTVLGGVHGFIWRASADHTVACAFDFGACRPDTVAAWKRQISDPTSLAQFSTAYVALAVFACMLLVVLSRAPVGMNSIRCQSPPHSLGNSFALSVMALHPQPLAPIWVS